MVFAEKPKSLKKQLKGLASKGLNPLIPIIGTILEDEQFKLYVSLQSPVQLKSIEENESVLSNFRDCTAI